jgi:hypothetical protein
VKITEWESRLIALKGRELLKTMESNDLKHLSRGEPTHWPSGRNRLPDLVDFCIAKGIPQVFAVAKSCCDLSSDHSAILITPTADVLNHENEPILSNRHTNWDEIRRLVNERLTLNIPPKDEEDIEVSAVFFNDTIQWAGWNATPEHSRTLEAYDGYMLLVCCVLLLYYCHRPKTKL